jgi:hypothetical protein
MEASQTINLSEQSANYAYQSLHFDIIIRGNNQQDATL